MRDSGRASLSQPRYTAHATAAGGVSERNPEKSPLEMQITASSIPNLFET